MASVTTKEEQRRAGKVVRHVGGYNELLRLARERSGIQGGRFYRDDEGRYQVGVAKEPDKHKDVVVVRRDENGVYREVKAKTPGKGVKSRLGISLGEARSIKGMALPGSDKHRR